MRDAVFPRASGWIPQVIREDGEVKPALGAGADANHEPRTFTFPVGEAHLAVIREDLARHLLLWSAVLPLCDAAGTRGRLVAHGADIDLLDRGRLCAALRAAMETSDGMRIGRDPRRGKRATDKRDWDRMAAATDTALRRAHPDRAGFGGSARRTPLSFTNDKGVEKKRFPDSPRTAAEDGHEGRPDMRADRT
ncbi:hypothetical protein GCM10010232_59230 [Streptomyces amakusaensis]